LVSLFDDALKLAVSCRPQDGCSAAYILRFLVRIPSFTDVLRKRLIAHDDDDDDDDDDGDDDSYYSCIVLLLQLLQRQLDVAAVNLLQVCDASVLALTRTSCE